MLEPRQWAFVADMDHSGSITISDVWLWFKWLYFYPGDGVIYFILHKVPKFGQFLEITNNNYGTFPSGTISFGVWVSAFLALVAIIDAKYDD